MSRKWTLLTLILFLGSGGALQAQPQDSPDIVYIDGSPCNRACQSYMEWSYRSLSARRHEAHETGVAIPAEAKTDRIEPMVHPRVARHVAPVSRAEPYGAKSASNGRTTGNKVSSSKKIAAANASPQTPRQGIPAAAAAPPPQQAASQTAAAEPKPAAKSEVATAVTMPPPATLEIATRPAAPAPGATSGKAGEAGKTASASSDDLDNLVALVLAAPEINSLSDLNNRNIAIAEKQSASSGRVSAALMAAGAAEVRFSEVKASAIDRLMDGAVPAAVVLAPREVANLFPEIAGFRTFRVPLKARL
jgi:hypothetical protein